jgi:hypothetical protein
MSLLEKNTRDIMIQMIANPHRKSYMHLRVICLAKNLDNTKLSTSTNASESSFDVVYTSGKILTTCNIELDEERYKSCVYVKIGWKRKAFRLGTWDDPNGVKNVHGQTEKMLKKDLLRDIGFQKAFFTKVIDYLETHVKDDVENATEKSKLAQEKEDIILQFPDWEVDSLYGHGWRLEHKTNNIMIEMTQQLDVQKIVIPTDKFMCYPDEEFMTKLLALFEAKPDTNDPF